MRKLKSLSGILCGGVGAIIVLDNNELADCLIKWGFAQDIDDKELWEKIYWDLNGNGGNWATENRSKRLSRIAKGHFLKLVNEAVQDYYDLGLDKTSPYTPSGYIIAKIEKDGEK